MVKELDSTEPEKREHFLNLLIKAVDLSTETLKRSPDLRRGFARIHSEFLKYPECRQTLLDGLAAYRKYVLEDKK